LSLQPPPETVPPRLAGPRLCLEPVHPGAADDDLRGLFAACSRRIAAGYDPAQAFAASLGAVEAGRCTAWAVRPAGGEAIGLAWLTAPARPGPGGGAPTAVLGAGWAGGRRVAARLTRELLLLVLGYAFETRRFGAVAVQVPGLRPVAPPLLAAEWPALRASLEARTAR
jgi:hypothetical protein